MNISIPVNNTMEFIEDTQISPFISHVKIKVCWVGQQPNRNHTVITKDVATEMGRNLPGSPIVGYYNKENKDFEQHNREIDFSDGDVKFVDTTRPYGFVPPDAKVWFQVFSDGGIQHEYLCTEGYIWTKAYPESQRIISNGNNQSMEIDRETSDGYWTNDVNLGKRIFIYSEALIEKLCVLGEHFEPCFEGASVTAFSLNSPEFEEFKTTMFSMINELKEAIKGGSDMEENKNVLPTETENPAEGNFAAQEDAPAENPTEVQAEFKKAEEDEEKKNSEDNSDKENSGENEDNKKGSEEEDDDKKKNYNLDEVVEYQELSTKYAALEAQLNELQDKYTALETEKNTLEGEVTGLREFKLAGERKAKEDMIASFYMLDDEAKKDCVENIDKYSLDDIEAKLSVYCFRNGINFATEEKTTEEQGIQPTSFSLNEQIDADDAPEWVKTVRKIQNKEEF